MIGKVRIAFSKMNGNSEHTYSAKFTQLSENEFHIKYTSRKKAYEKKALHLTVYRFDRLEMDTFPPVLLKIKFKFPNGDEKNISRVGMINYWKETHIFINHSFNIAEREKENFSIFFNTRNSLIKQRI